MKRNILIITIIATISFLAGRFLLPPKPEVKEVIKVVEVEKKQEKKDKVVTSKKTRLPDGTEVTETKVTENTETNTDKKSQIDSSKTTKSTSKITLGILAIKQVDRFSESLQYGATVTVPLLGNLKVQALGTTDKKIGLGLALDF